MGTTVINTDASFVYDCYTMTGENLDGVEQHWMSRLF